MARNSFSPGGYEIIRFLGSGGTAHVYLAQRLSDSRLQALKMPLDDTSPSREKFLPLIRREHDLIGQLRYPGLVRVWGVNEMEATLPFLTLEFCPGVTLDQIGEPDTSELLLNIISSISINLYFLRLAGLSHGDLKPQNIFLNNQLTSYINGNLSYSKISDFSLALRDTEEKDARLGLGTVGYMAPETVDSGLLDHRSDIFSLGVIAYRLATGKHPFLEDETDPVRINARVKEYDPPALETLNSSLPGGFSDLVKMMLTKEPQERPESGFAICVMLEKLGAGYPFRRAIRPKHLLELKKADDCLSLLNRAPLKLESPIVERLYDYSGEDLSKLRNILEINFSLGLISWHQGYIIVKGGPEQIIYPRRLQVQVGNGYRRLSYSAKKKAVMAAILGSAEAAETIGLLIPANEKAYLTRPLLYAISGQLSRCTVRRFAGLLAHLAHQKAPTNLMAAHLYMRAEDLQDGYAVAWDMVNALIDQNENAGALELLSAMEKTCRIKNETAKLGLVLMKRADLEKTIGEANWAEKTYQQIIDLYRGQPSDKLLAETYKDLGDLYKMKQDYNSGIEALEKARLIYSDIGDQLELSHTLNNIGNIHSISGQMDKAYNYFRQAFRIQRRLEAKSDVASTLNNMSFIFYVRGRLDRVIRVITLSLNLNREIGNALEIARALNNRGFFYNEIGRFDKALEDLQESLEINRKIGNKKELLFNLDNLTQVMISAGRLKESFQFLREGMNLASELADMPHTGVFTGNMAVVQKRMGHYGKAMESAARAVAIGEQLDANNDHILSRINLADLYYRLNDRGRARNTIETALKLAQERGDKRALTSIYSILSLIDNDFSLMEKAETIAMETKVSRDISLVRLKKSALLLQARNSENAFQVLSGLTAIFREDNPDIENAGYFILLGDHYLSRGNLQEARTFLEKGYRIASDSALLPEMISAAVGMGRIHTVLHDYETAYAYYKKAINGVKAIADDIKDNSLRQSFLSDRKIASLAGEVRKLSQLLAKK